MATTPPGPSTPTTGSDDATVVVLAGGVGGSKLVRGLASVLAPGQLTIVVNTADDMIHMGLHVSPDLDTVCHRLADLHDAQRGWGRADETWTVMQQVAALDGPDWFSLGDRDLATHLVRTHLLAEGASLAEATHHLCRQWGIDHPVVPMTNDPVATWLHTDEGELSFQDYFVNRACEPVVSRIEFRGGDEAVPAPGVVAAITRADLVVLAPSNPFLSIDPIIAIPAIGAALRRRVAHDPIVAVSPIVGDAALRGPAAKLLAEFDLPVSPEGVGSYLAGRLARPGDLPGDGLTGLVVDEPDAGVAVDGVTTLAAPIVMGDAAAETDLARRVLSDGLALAARGRHDVVTVVPVAAIARTKTRLADVLADDQRQRVATALVASTVRTAGHLGPVVVVVEDDEMGAVARAAGAVVMRQERSGLNDAVAQGIAWATRRSNTVMVVPSDLPRVTVAALQEVLDVASAMDQGVVVVPDQRDDGTNALVLRAMPPMPPQYGPASAAAHADTARALGVPVVIHRCEALGDLDTTEDWHRFGHLVDAES